MKHSSSITKAAGLPLVLLASGVLTLTTSACGSRRGQPLQPLQKEIDLQRFMGKWYVIAHIPIDTFFASEANAYDAVEEYELDDDGTTIRTTFTFREGSFDGDEKVMKPTGFVCSDSNTEWRMQFIWPFKSAYLIVYVDDDYETTIVSVPDRSYAWIMARTAQISDQRYEALVDELRGMGHDLSKLRKVPHTKR